jgi:hypothetical protein
VTLADAPEPGTDQDPAPDPVPAEAVTEPPPSLPFIPAEGVAGWLRDALTEYDRRLRNAGY